MFAPDAANRSNPIRVVYVHEEWRQRLLQSGEPIIDPPVPEPLPASKVSWFRCYSAPQEPQSPNLSYSS